VAEFSNDEVHDGVAATKWCLKHNLVQQGFTLLQETLFTFILQQSTDENTDDICKRNLVGMAVKVEQEQKKFDDWSEPAKKHRKIIEKICGWLHSRKELLDCMRNLSKDRNDLNHAGMNDSPMAADKFRDKLNNYIEIVASHACSTLIV